MLAFMLGALAATAVPTVTPMAPPTVIIPAAPRRAAAPDMAAMLKMFDKFFPPQPEPEPARLALARTTSQALVPPGSVGQAVGEMMGAMVERVLDLRASDFPVNPAKASPKGTPGDQNFHQSLLAKDPYFDERMRLTRAAVEIELSRFSSVIEPRLREGVARAVARRFDQRQLTEINAFFTTDSGKALGKHFLGLWFDPDLMRSMVAAAPDMMRLMPGSLERIVAATAHLPKPPKSAKPAPPPKPNLSRP